jgi:adenylate cyclase
MDQRGTSSAEAYELYLMARYYWVTGNYGDIRREERVIRICQRAIAIDPEYGRAWALLAIAQANLRYSFGRLDDDGMVEAERALSLDPGIAEAHCVIARNLFESGRFEEANKEIEVALSLDPDSWEVNRESARILYRQRRMTEAARHFQKAVEAQPDHATWRFRYGKLLAANHKNEPARIELSRALELAEKFPHGERWLWEAHHLLARVLGAKAEAAPHWEAFLRLGPLDSPYRAEAKAILERLGRPWTGN